MYIVHTYIHIQKQKQRTRQANYVNRGHIDNMHNTFDKKMTVYMLRRRCFTENSKLSETVCSRMQCLSRPQSDAQPPPRPTSPTQTPSTTQRRLSWHPNAGRYGELWVSPPGKQCRLYRMIQISIQIWRPWPLTFLLSLCAFSDCVGVFLRNTNFMNSNASCFN